MTHYLMDDSWQWRGQIREARPVYRSGLLLETLAAPMVPIDTFQCLGRRCGPGLPSRGGGCGFRRRRASFTVVPDGGGAKRYSPKREGTGDATQPRNF